MKRHFEDMTSGPHQTLNGSTSSSTWSGEPGISQKSAATSFAVTPLEKFNQKLPSYRKPMEIGRFSLDRDRAFHDDERQLRYFAPPMAKKVAFDLRAGYKEFLRRDEDKKEKLDHLLQWIELHRDRFLLKGEKLQDSKSIHTDFVSWRGHFTKIFCTPYESREPWQLAATRYHGTIYISEVETAEAREKRKNVSPKQDEMCYWGLKFEDYVTTPVDARLISQEGAVNQNEAFITIIRSRMNRHSFVLGAEVDCCKKDSMKSPPDNYIELKTSRHIENTKQNWSFGNYKLIKWWAQSFLAGIPDVICGFRNDDGVVEELRTFKTLDIPRSVQKQQSNSWDAAVCLNFCDKFLDWVKKVVVKDDPRVVYMFHWRHPFTHVYVEEKYDEDSVFLPSWYTSQ